jgi:hypothetical protein
VSLITSIFSTICSGGASLGGKIIEIAVAVVVLIAVIGGCYLYLHHKNVAIAAAQAAAIQSQTELSSVIAANAEDQKLIEALRAQQVQAEAARVAMTARAQVLQDSVASIQSLIDREAVVFPIAPVASTSARVVGKDAVVAPVLSETLAELAKSQTLPGAKP